MLDKFLGDGKHDLSHAAGRQRIGGDATGLGVDWMAGTKGVGESGSSFRLDSDKDALYPGTPSGLAPGTTTGGVGTPRRDPTGQAGNDVGSELDLVTNFHLTDRQDVLFNYCHFFPGTFIKRTGPGIPADFVYAQYTYRW